MAVGLIEVKMLYCPKCNKTYQEGTQRFCINDGSRLVSSATAAKSAAGSKGIFTGLLGKSPAASENDERMVQKPNQQSRPIQRSTPPVFISSLTSKVFKDQDLSLKKMEEIPVPAKPAVRLVKPIEIVPGTAEVSDQQTNPTVRATLGLDNLSVLIGQTVKGRYLVTERLTQDDSSIVFLAEDKIIDQKRVNIRVLTEEKNDEFLRTVFAEERVSLSHINHPNVAGVLDSGELLDGFPFIVTENVDGFSLKEKLHKLEHFNAQRTARIIRQSSYALSEVHQNGILHRSLNPSNIFLTVSEAGTELVKVADFVVSNGAKRQNLEGVKYLAPEQLEGKMPNFSSDLYSLAVIAFEMLTGKIPFAANNADDHLKTQKSGLPEKASELRADLPEAVDAVFERALAYSPTERYPKARDFGDALFFALGISVAEAGTIETETKSQSNVNMRASSILIPRSNEEKESRASNSFKIQAQPVDDAEIIEIAGDQDDFRQFEGELSWERRSPETVRERGALWQIVGAMSVLVMLVAAVLLWNYFRNRQTPDIDYSQSAGQTKKVPGDSTMIANPDPNMTVVDQEVPPPARQISQPPNTEYFENSKLNRKGDLAKNYRGFSLSYPKTWNKGSSGTTFLEIAKPANDGAFSESLLVTHYPSTGLFSKDRASFPKLVAKSNKDLGAQLGSGFRVISQGETKIQNGRWSVYEVRFEATVMTNSGKPMTIWGRRFWLPTQNTAMRNGYVVTLLATSLSTEFASVDDVGNKGDLAMILETFEPSARD